MAGSYAALRRHRGAAPLTHFATALNTYSVPIDNSQKVGKNWTTMANIFEVYASSSPVKGQRMVGAPQTQQSKIVSLGRKADNLR